MRIRGAEVGVPGVEVGIEVQHGDRAVVAIDRAENRQRDGVVAAEGEHRRGSGPQLSDGRLDCGQRLRNIERIGRHITGVCHLQACERLYFQRGVVRPQQLRRCTDVARSKTCARAIADAGIERHSEDRDIGARHLVEPRQPGERSRAGITGTWVASTGP